MNVVIQKLIGYDFLNIEIEDKVPLTKVTMNPPSGMSSKYGIDTSTMLQSTQVHEMAQTISKKIFNDIANLGTVTDLDLDQIMTLKRREHKLADVLENSKEKFVHTTHQMQQLVFTEVKGLVEEIDADIIITNSAMGAAFQDSYDFEFQKMDDDSINLGSAMANKIGRMYGCDVYTDPYMRFNDNRIFVGKINCDLLHNDKADFNSDYTEFEFGFDVKLNDSKVKTLNIVDNNMMMI